MNKTFCVWAWFQMNIHEAEMGGEPLIDSMKPKDAWCLQVAPGIEVAILFESPSPHNSTWDSPQPAIIAVCSEQRLNDQPFPHQIRRGVTISGIVLQTLSH